MVYQAADRLSAMIASYFSGGKVSIGLTCWMPALLTRMSTRPKSAIVSFDQAGGLVALHQIGAVVDDAAERMILLEFGANAHRSRAGSPRPLMTTSAPACGHGAGDAEADPAGRTGDDRNAPRKRPDDVDLFLDLHVHCERS